MVSESQSFDTYLVMNFTEVDFPSTLFKNALRSIVRMRRHGGDRGSGCNMVRGKRRRSEQLEDEVTEAV